MRVKRLQKSQSEGTVTDSVSKAVDRLEHFNPTSLCSKTALNLDKNENSSLFIHCANDVDKEVNVLQTIQRESMRLGLECNKNIISFLDYFVYRKHQFIVMEAMGMNMRQFCSVSQKGSLSVPSSTSIVAGVGLPLKLIRLFANQLFQALEHIHLLGYVHADIKVHNVSPFFYFF